MAARLILNPAAGADEALTVLEHLNERLRAGFGHLDIVITGGHGDAEAAAARAARAGETTILVGGGDGTLNEVLNGVHHAGRLGDITFGIVPLGTCVVMHPGAASADTASGPISPGRIELFAVCNSRQIGGGRLIAPEALVDDGWLDVCVIEAMPTLEFVGLLRDVAEGAHLGDPRVSYLRARQLAIAFDRPVNVNTDGQVLETDRCHYRILPHAARFLAAPTGHA